MTQEEKQLLIKDLCARLTYGVILDNPNPCGEHWDELISIDIPNGTVTLLYDGRTYKIEDVKPYFRPLSSMTSKEWTEYCDACVEDEMSWTWARTGKKYKFTPLTNREEFLNSHHFDYRGLIEKGLALEAPEGMYKIK